MVFQLDVTVLIFGRGGYQMDFWVTRLKKPGIHFLEGEKYEKYCRCPKSVHKSTITETTESQILRFDQKPYLPGTPLCFCALMLKTLELNSKTYQKW